MARSRGYSTQRFKTLQSSYNNKPTALQQASYSVFMIGLVRSHNVEALERIMPCGISPNPCNSFGESLVHNVCRRGDHEILEIFVNSGCALNVCDDYGRTPLHDACWAAEPAFEVVKMILEKDCRLFHMIDSRDRLPLGYVREEHWPHWIEFLEAHKDVFWPHRPTDQPEPPPRLCQQGCNTRPLPDPPNALSIEMATLVAAGRLSPEEAQILISHDEGTSETEDDCLSFSSDEDSDDSSDCSGSSRCGSIANDSEADDDMNDLLAEMTALRAQCAPNASIAQHPTSTPMVDVLGNFSSSLRELNASVISIED
jgi:hypothetical protein